MGLWYAGHQRNKEKTYPEAGETKIKAPLNSSGHKIRSPRDHGDNGHVEGIHHCNRRKWLCPFLCEPQPVICEPRHRSPHPKH